MAVLVFSDSLIRGFHCGRGFLGSRGIVPYPGGAFGVHRVVVSLAAAQDAHFDSVVAWVFLSAAAGWALVV